MSVESIYNRRSIRKYKQKEVSIDILNQILEAGRAAPSGKNKQPWKFIVFGGEKKNGILSAMERGIKRELNGQALLPNTHYGIPDAENTLKIMKTAPIVVMVLNIFGKSPFELISNDERVTEIVDSLSIGAAVQNMLLEADSLGIGTLWIGNTFFAYRELVEYIKTEGQLIGAVCMGYSDEMPYARQRKELKDIVEYNL